MKSKSSQNEGVHMIAEFVCRPVVLAPEAAAPRPLLIRIAKESLTPKQRDIFLGLLNGRDLTQTGKKLKMSHAQARACLKRALTRVRRQLSLEPQAENKLSASRNGQ